MFICSLFIGLLQAIPATVFAIDAGDDFNDNVKDTNNWADMDVVFNNGVLTEANGRLEFTVIQGSSFDESARPWILTQFPYTNDWEVQVSTFDFLNFIQKKQVSTLGMYVRNWVDPNDQIYHEMYNSTFFGLPPDRGFFTSVDTDDFFEGSIDTFDDVGSLNISNGAIRVAFNSMTKVITTFYDVDVSNGFQWVLLSSVGINGSGGDSGDTDWDMGDGDRFAVQIYGYTEKTAVTSGQLYLDDFASIGGVPFVIPPTRLVASWTSASEKCKQSGETTSCSIKGKLTLTNNESSVEPVTRIRVFLSTSNVTFEEGVDVLLGTFETKELKAGKLKKLNVKATRDSSSAGAFLLAVADNGAVLASFQLPVPPS